MCGILTDVFCHSHIYTKACKNKCVFEKRVVLFLVCTRAVKRTCNLISIEKATYQCEKCRTAFE